MGPVETAGIVVVVGLVLAGVFKLCDKLISKYGHRKNGNVLTNKDLLDAIGSRKCGLSDRQSEQLKILYDLHNVKDPDGAPIWYVPRSWAENQKEIVDIVRKIAETQHRTLDIIERLEKRLDS